MNVYLILIGVVMVILMVTFGRNPVEEARQAHKAQFNSDPLIGATQQYLSKQNSAPGGSSASIFGPSGSQLFNQPAGGSAPSYMVNHGQPGYPAANPYPNPYQGQQQQESNDYYPPPAPGTTPSPQQQQQEQQRQQQLQQLREQWPSE